MPQARGGERQLYRCDNSEFTPSGDPKGVKAWIQVLSRAGSHAKVVWSDPCGQGACSTMSELFRREALTRPTRSLSGVVVLRASRTSLWITLMLVAAVVMAVLFAATASYARRETVTGWLVPPAGLIRQAARQGGVVQRLHVEEGQQVSVGQPIATIRLSESTASGDSFDQLAETFGTQQAASRSRSEANLAALAAEQAALQRRLTALRLEKVEASRRVQLQRERLRLAEGELRRAEPVAAQGFLPARELEARRVAVLQADQNLSEMTASVLSAERQVDEAESRLRAIPIDMRAARADAATAEAGIAQQRTQAETAATYVVVATVAGRVSAIPVSLGQALSAGGAVAVVGQGNQPLEAELYVPSRAAGFVRQGQEVRLMYQAFPFQKFGAGHGRVVSVSKTVLAPAEVQLPGSQVEEPVFRVRARIADAAVAAYGQDIPLQPGMLLNADIVLDRRNLFEWLLDPLYAAGRR